MRLLATALALTAALAGTASAEAGPCEIVEDFFNAIKDSRGADAAALMSSSVLSELDMLVAMMQMDPATAAEELSTMGSGVTEEDVMAMTGESFIAMVLSSEDVAGVLGTTELVEVTQVSLEGDSALVRVCVTIMGETNEDTMPMVLEEGEWKVGSIGLQM